MNNRKWSVKITFLFFPAIFIMLLFSHVLNADAADPKKKLNKIQKRIQSKKKRVKEAIKKERSILSQIQYIDKDIKSKEKELKRLDRKISETQVKILGLSKEINALTNKLNGRKDLLNNRLKTLYKQQYGGYALILVKAKDYQDLVSKSKYISLIAHHDSKIIKSFKSEIADVNFKKKNLEVLRDKLEENRKDAKTQKKSLRTDRIRKDKLLATIRSKRSAYERTIRELEESSRKLQEMMKRLEEQKAARRFSGKKFSELKGHLPWPVNGKVLIPYGKYTDPKFKITVFKNGVEIEASQEDTPKAVDDGRVVYADWFKGYGLLLIINHGNGYHSLYGNLSEIFHDTGDIIKRGTSVGKIGVSSLLNVPTLYFEIRHKGKPVNPIRWLKRKIRRKKL